MTTNEKKLILVVAGFTLLVGIIIFTIILPTANNIKKINTETYNLKYYLEKKYESVSRIKNSAEQAEEIKKEVFEFKKYLFSRGNELELITSLEQMATKNNVSQNILSSNLDKQNQQKVEFDLKISGKYEDVLKYILDIEENPYFFEIKSLQLNKDGNIKKNMESEMTNLNLKIELYAKN